ncbi:RNA polymerase sigma factor [Marinobacterium sp. BA1]|uniref:RNA polymerase sigma factor n=1 Tax=Marinobacterium sp. BA1 TaxID=3138931 RepID=UPI0032E6115D
MLKNSTLLHAFMECKPDLLRFLKRRLGSSSLAVDMVHDQYLKICDMKDQPSVGNHKAYLFGMAANLATDHLRTENRRSEILQEASGVVWQETDELSPERHTLAKAELAYLAQAAAGLSDRTRHIFHLSRYEGKSQAEIAEQLGVGLTTIHKDLKTAMAVLRAARRRFHDQAPGDNQADHYPSKSKVAGNES